MIKEKMANASKTKEALNVSVNLIIVRVVLLCLSIHI